MILNRAADLLAASADGDISTRAVCEAAGIGQPVLYRLFGDKDGLLAAVADRVWGDYLESKRAAVSSADVLADLRDGWDKHTAFALAHPHAYRLVFASSLSARSEAWEEAMGLLRGVLDRVAGQGLLRQSVDEVAHIVMAANSGIALALLLHPAQYPDPALSVSVRDATFRAILVDDGDAEARDAADARRAAAATLQAEAGDLDLFTAGEFVLLREWLTRIQNS